jgi:hypothetical protein
MMIPRECDYCGEISEDVELCEDPFSSEINDDHTERLICPKCYTERAREV